MTFQSQISDQLTISTETQTPKKWQPKKQWFFGEYSPHYVPPCLQDCQLGKNQQTAPENVVIFHPIIMKHFAIWFWFWVNTRRTNYRVNQVKMYAKHSFHRSFYDIKIIHLLRFSFSFQIRIMKVHACLITANMNIKNF